MAYYDSVKSLPLTVSDISFERREADVSTGFARVTTTVRLEGKGYEGAGEDVVYEAEFHDFYAGDGAELQLKGEYDLGSFSHRLDELSLFSTRPLQEAYVDYRRWAFESAALDLVLKQTGSSLHEILGLRCRPVNFLVSLNLSDSPEISDLQRILDQYPGTRFKLDAGKGWTGDFIADLARMDVVDCIDFKGHYKGTIVDQEIDVDLYRRIADAFPSCWLEDPGVSPESEYFLHEYQERVTWDAPIHSIRDIERLPHRPRCLNMKPSRFGTVQRLFDACEYCEANDILMYGGGQFELGVGRGHIQYMASLFHPDGPNDVAPVGYNQDAPGEVLPQSPLELKTQKAGLG